MGGTYDGYVLLRISPTLVVSMTRNTRNDPSPPSDMFKEKETENTLVVKVNSNVPDRFGPSLLSSSMQHRVVNILHFSPKNCGIRL